MSWILSAFADEAGGSLDEQIAALNEADIKYIDPRGVNGFSIVKLPLDHAEKIQKKLEAASIKVAMFGSPIGKIDISDDINIDIENLEHLGKLKDIFNCNTVRIFSYFNKKDADHNTWQTQSIQHLETLINIAQKLDMVLYHENERHIFGDKIIDVCTLRDQLRAKYPQHFKLIFDFDNFNQSGESVTDAWNQLASASDTIHLKDSKKQPSGEYHHVPVGEGDGNIPQILADMVKIGWQGQLTLEPHLAHSKAVLATGPSGKANQQLSSLTPAQAFQVAAKAAKKLLSDVGKL